MHYLAAAPNLPACLVSRQTFPRKCTRAWYLPAQTTRSDSAPPRAIVPDAAYPRDFTWLSDNPLRALAYAPAPANPRTDNDSIVGVGFFRFEIQVHRR